MRIEYTLDMSRVPSVAKRLDPFTRGYIEAAMWTLTDDDGRSLNHLGLHDVAPETIASAIADCREFQVENALDLIGVDAAQAGRDYWLTRNRHGAGFWDGDYPEEIGRRLTAAAHADGSADWYLRDDGLVYEC